MNKFSSNSKTSNRSIVDLSNEVEKSWNNSNTAKASSCSWTEVQTKTRFVNQSSSWGGKDSLNELFKRNNPSNTLYSNYLTTNISTTYSTPNRLDNTSGNGQMKRFQIMQDRIIHLMNSATITFVHIVKIHSLHMIHHGNQQTNIKKKPFIK